MRGSALRTGIGYITLLGNAEPLKDQRTAPRSGPQPQPGGNQHTREGYRRPGEPALRSSSSPWPARRRSAQLAEP